MARGTTARLHQRDLPADGARHDCAPASDEDACLSEEEVSHSSALSPGFLFSTPSAASSQDADEYASYLHHGVVNGQLTSVEAQTFYAAMLASGTKRAYDDPNGSFIGMVASTEGGAPSSAHTISDSDNGSDCSDIVCALQVRFLIG
jgi:hypothetical protein